MRVYTGLGSNSSSTLSELGENRSISVAPYHQDLHRDNVRLHPFCVQKLSTSAKLSKQFSSVLIVPVVESSTKENSLTLIIDFLRIENGFDSGANNETA